jgi:recombination protein RecA
MAKGSNKIESSRNLEETLNSIRDKFGEGSIMTLQKAKTMNVETIPTGSISLDLALGGGIPKGRIIEIYGPEASGKTTLAMHIMAEVQKKAAWRRSSTPSTHWIRIEQKPSE